MGHRTLLAYDRAGYDLHYAHWGVDPDAITAETPFGGPPETEWADACADELLDPEGGHLTREETSAVSPDPIATGLSFRDICAYVDPLVHEALYIVTPAYTVRTYLVFGVETPDGGETTALVGYDGDEDAAYLRGWLAGGRAVRDVGRLDAGTIVRALRWLAPERGTVVYPAAERGT